MILLYNNLINRMSVIPCAGIIIFNKNLETILVKTDTGRYSFPKGKREHGESSIENAAREMTEETGIPINQISIIPGTTYDEISGKGFPSVRYFVGLLNPNYKSTFTYDSKELIEVKFWSVENALKLDGFKDDRKEILKEAYAKVKNDIVQKKVLQPDCAPSSSVSSLQSASATSSSTVVKGTSESTQSIIQSIIQPKSADL